MTHLLTNEPRPNRTDRRETRQRRVGIAAILASHAMLDAYAMAVPASLVLLESRCGLSVTESAWLLGAGPLFSGLSQPICAWISDRTNSRLFTGLGLAATVVCVCLMGHAQGFLPLLLLYMPAMIFAGSYHPVSAACIGELGGHRRSLAASAFFVADMIGGSFGSYWGPRFLTRPNAFELLPYLMVPGILLAGFAFRAVASFAHRRPTLPTIGDDDGQNAELSARYWMVAVLFISAAIRFTVNLSLIFLATRLVQSQVAAAHLDWTAEQIALEAAPRSGTLVSCLIAGMGVGGLLTGWLVRAGREKWPLVGVPIMFAPAIWIWPQLSASWQPFVAVAAGVGFAANVPVGMAVAQRLLPHRTGLASGLMLGGAWSLSLVGPQVSQWGIEAWGIAPTYQAVAIALVLSGIVNLCLRSSLIRKTVSKKS